MIDLEVCYLQLTCDVPRFSSPLQVGGHVIAHASTIRLSLRKGKAEQRIMKVSRAPTLSLSHSLAASAVSNNICYVSVMEYD